MKITEFNRMLWTGWCTRVFQLEVVFYDNRSLFFVFYFFYSLLLLDGWDEIRSNRTGDKQLLNINVINIVSDMTNSGSICI